MSCTGFTSVWCPSCGECACSRLADGSPTLAAPDCPLHGSSSAHADNQERARLAGVLDQVIAAQGIVLSDEDRAEVTRFAQWLSESSRKRGKAPS